MTKLFGIVINNALVEEVDHENSAKQNTQRTLINGTIIRIERDLPDHTYQVRCLKDDRDNWDTSQFKISIEKCHLIPEKLWQFLAAVQSPLERVKLAQNKERYEKLLLISVDMVVAYSDDDNVLLGTVKHIGKVKSIGWCYGIKLYEKKSGSRCNGSIANVQYFPCLPGFGIFATIERVVAHNVISNITGDSDKCSTQQDDLTGDMKELKSSQLLQPLPIETKREFVNMNNDFDDNTILQSDRLLLLSKKEAKYSSGLRTANINELKFGEALPNAFENDNMLQPESAKLFRNRNSISHAINSSKTISKKRKVPTFKSYDSEFNQQCLGTSIETSKSEIDGVLYIEPDPALTNDITVGTLVQIIEEGVPKSGDTLCGVVRWLGIKVIRNQERDIQLQRSSNIMVGVEMDDDDMPPDLDFIITDGMFDGLRRFDTQHAVFVPLTMCRKDWRFVEECNGQIDTLPEMGVSGMLAQTGQNGPNLSCGRISEIIKDADLDKERRVREVKQKLFEAENGKPVIEGIVAPLLFKTEEDVKAVCSKFRGIQGHHNSCYLDATLFSMFTFTSVFDSLIYRPKRPNDIPQYDEVQRVLREEIVNPLRSNLFVNAQRVMTLRRHLDKLSSVSGLTTEEKDPEEFLNSLLAQILRAEPFLKLNSGQESYFYQLFVEKDDRLKLPTVQQLFEQSFHTSDIKLKEVPSCLIIQMPRFGKNYKMYPRIIPSQLLDITDIIENSPRGCTICGNLAYYECVRCYAHSNNGTTTSDTHDDGLENTAFCSKCVRMFHGTHRTDHEPRLLVLPPDYQILVEGGHESPQPPRLYMDLFAVVCIETSHYVAFVKCGNDVEAPWCFFDSMADREGERNGFNIPAMVACPDVSKWLSDEQSCHILHRDIPSDRHLPEHARRLLCDAYICMYQKRDVMMYR